MFCSLAAIEPDFLIIHALEPQDSGYFCLALVEQIACAISEKESDSIILAYTTYGANSPKQNLSLSVVSDTS